MWSSVLKSPPHTFASLVEVLRARDLLRFLPQLQQAGVKSALHLESFSKSQLRAIMGDVALDHLFAPVSRTRKRTRQDIPVVHERTRGSLQRIGIEPSPPLASDAPPLDLAAVDEAFLRDRWAATSQAPRESRWVTWQKLAARRGLAPLPLTRESLFAVGALLKAAGYRSASQYFSVARQKHSEAGHEWTPELQEARAQSLRSINRGIGPATPKLDLCLENARSDFSQQVGQAFETLRCAPDERISFPSQACVTASWFMLRGIELANVQGRDVTFRKANREVSLSLPVSKTDPEGRGCSRVHRCICSLRHEASCQQRCPEEHLFTPLQRCDCSYGRSPLCVFHALLQVVVSIRQAGRWAPEVHLFRAPSSSVASPTQVVHLARACALVLQQQVLEEWGAEAVKRWAQHVFRVAGAQLFARSYLDLPYIQLMGRWGSMAVLRYVQEAAVQLPAKASDAVAMHLDGPPRPSQVRSSTPPQPMQVPQPSILSPQLQDLIRSVVHESMASQGALVHNVRSKVAHKPALDEQNLPSTSWVSRCGKWWYGLSSCIRNPHLVNGYVKCASCFQVAPQPNEQVQAVESGTESSTSASDADGHRSAGPADS